MMKKRYEKIESFQEDSLNTLKESYKSILSAIGESPEREGLLNTPLRAGKAMHFFTQGYEQDPKALMEPAIFHEDYSEMVIVKDIEIFSLCEHHMIPFFGRAHIAYIPNGKIVGLSKVARVVDVFAKRLQVQERLTCQIRDCIKDVLNPLGVAVVIEAKHLCMMMRGVQKQNSVTTTSAFTGEFENKATRDEFINLINAKLS